MFSFTPRLDVQICIVARGAFGLHEIVPVVVGQLLNLIVDLLADQIALLDPSRHAVCRAYLGKAPVVVEHFDAIAILYDSGFLVNSGHAVAQYGLYAGNVSRLQYAPAATLTARRKYRASQRKGNPGRTQQKCGEKLHRIEVLL